MSGKELNASVHSKHSAGSLYPPQQPRKEPNIVTPLQPIDLDVPQPTKADVSPQVSKRVLHARLDGSMNLATAPAEAEGPVAAIDDETMVNFTQKVILKKQRVARRFFREMVGYFVFMVIFCVVTYALRTSYTFFLTDTVRGNIMQGDWALDKTFETIVSVDDFWAWTANVLHTYLYPTKLYNTDGNLTAPQMRNSMWYNLRVGKVRFRQNRVTAGANCRVSSKFESQIKTCYPEWSLGKEANHPYGPAALSAVLPNGTQWQSAFVWKSQEEMCRGQGYDGGCKYKVVGLKGERYAGSGYSWELSSDSETALEELAQLKANDWIDLATRAVIVEYTLYNPNVRLLCAVQTVLELYPTGSVGVIDTIKPTPVLTWETSMDKILFAGEVILQSVVAVYFALEVYEFWRFYRVKRDRCPVCNKEKCIREGEERRLKCFECQYLFNQFRLPICPRCSFEVPLGHMCWRGYFQDLWNLLDIVNYALFFVVFAMRIQMRVDMSALTFGPSLDNSYFTFFPLAWDYSLSNWLSAVNALLCFGKTFKYLGKIKSLSTLVKALALARLDLLYFVVVFLVIFCGFALGFHLAFGTDVAGFRGWSESLITLLLYLLGDFNYTELRLSNRILAPLFFCFYQLTVFFILVNMFVAIVSGAHTQAKELIATGRDDFLSSALKLLVRDWRASISQHFPLLIKPEQNSESLRGFLIKVERIEGLTGGQIDDIRYFWHEVRYHPEIGGLVAVIRRIFNIHTPQIDKLERKLQIADYMTLRTAVQLWRSLGRRAATARIWDNDSSSSDDDDEGFEDAFMASMDAAANTKEKPQEEAGPKMGKGLGIALKMSGWAEKGKTAPGARIGILEDKMDTLVDSLKVLCAQIEASQEQQRL